MRSRVFPAVMLASLAACAPSAPPASAPSAGTSADEDVPPVLALLSERQRLALEPAQVVALESIARDWEAADDTLSRRIGAAKGRGPNPLRRMLGKHVLAAVAENNRRTALAVSRVLHPDQRETLCTTQRLRRQTASAVRAAKDMGGNGPVAATGKAPGSVRALTAFARRRAEPQRAWPWCASSADLQSSSAN